MGLVLPPVVKPVSADNATGANLTPDSDCREFIWQDQSTNPSLDFTITIGVKTITRPAGYRLVFRALKGSYFPNGVSLGTVKAATAGTIVFAVEER